MHYVATHTLFARSADEKCKNAQEIDPYNLVIHSMITLGT